MTILQPQTSRLRFGGANHAAFLSLQEAIAKTGKTAGVIALESLQGAKPIGNGCFGYVHNLQLPGLEDQFVLKSSQTMSIQELPQDAALEKSMPEVESTLTAAPIARIGASQVLHKLPGAVLHHNLHRAWSDIAANMKPTTIASMLKTIMDPACPVDERKSTADWLLQTEFTNFDVDRHYRQAQSRVIHLKQALQEYRQDLKRLAGFPQQKYLDLVKAVKELYSHGLGTDFAHYGNLKADFDRQQFGVLDVGQVGREGHSVESCKALVQALLGEQARSVNAWESADDKDIRKSRQRIITKVEKAAKEAGLA